MHVLQDLKSKRLPSLALHPSLTWTEYLGLLTYTGMGGHPSNDLKEESIFLSVIFFLFISKSAPCSYYYVALTIYFVHIYSHLYPLE